MSLVLKGETSLEGRLNAFKAVLRLKSRADMDGAGQLLISAIRHARVSRHFEDVDAICDIVSTLLPDTPFSRIAAYNKADCLHIRSGTSGALASLGSATDSAPPQFRSSALLTLACAHLRAGQIREFGAASKEALDAARGLDPLSELQALRSMAVVQAVDGDHQGSLSLLESLLPTALFLGRWYPADFYNHLNSLAIEMGEVGRAAEASHLIDIVLRTEFASRYPGWLDTKIQLEGKPNLVFAPFTFAIGAPPVQDEIESTASASSELPVPVSVSEPEPRAKIRFVRPHSKAQILYQSPPIRRIRLGRLSQYVSTVLGRTGYVVSPPSRAPPSASSAI